MLILRKSNIVNTNMHIPLIEKIHSETNISIRDLKNIFQSAVKTAEQKNIVNKYGYGNAALEYVRRKAGIATDAESQRYIDENGSLIAPNSIITGEDVSNYLGSEIPRWQELGLNPNKIYRVFRPISEIQDNNFNGKYILSIHIGDFDATTMEKYASLIIGTVYDCIQVLVQIKGTAAFTSVNAIDEIENGKRYLSAGYWYDPVLESGSHNGVPYDIRMTNIRANHVALVDNPRYKPAIVGDDDKHLINQKGVKMSLKTKYPTLFKFFGKLGMDEDLTDKAVTAMDEEEAEKAEKAAQKKAEDEATEEAEKKKAQNEADEKAKEKAEDEANNCDKPAMDSDTVNKLVEAKVAKAMDSFKTEFTKQFVANNKAMDSALSVYSKLYGEPNRLAFDSADSVYDSILKNAGMSPVGRSSEYKQGVAEMLIQQSKPKASMAMDASSIDGLSPELSAFLKQGA